MLTNNAVKGFAKLARPVRRQISFTPAALLEKFTPQFQGSSFVSENLFSAANTNTVSASYVNFQNLSIGGLFETIKHLSQVIL